MIFLINEILKNIEEDKIQKGLKKRKRKTRRKSS